MPNNETAMGRRKLSLCVGSSRQAATWHPTQMSIEELWNKLQTPIRTPETTAQYHAMTKCEKDVIKDKGGFMAGTLKGTRRKKAEVLCRSMITLDGDKLRQNFFDDYKFLIPYYTLLYTTHSHLPEAPRARLLFPLTRDATPEEFNAIARYLADEIGMEMIDPCSFEVNQLMYWPTASADGEYICRQYDGEWLDPDMYLEGHPNWRDCTALPITPSEKAILDRPNKKQEDPLTKEGTVGAFCRVYYPIQNGIGKYLSDVYAPSTVDNRYDYIPGEGSCGVVIYDDRFVYSHHATDPAGGKLLNLFDLVRIHRFVDDDEKTSFLKMCALAESDELVKEELGKEQLAKAQAEFKDVESSWEEPILFGKCEILPFPVDALPPDLGAYVLAAAESTQTPVDMPGCAVLSMVSVGTQGKIVIRGKADWHEPLCLYILVTMPPSDRKSAIANGSFKPADHFEKQYNKVHSAEVKESQIYGHALERRQKAVEDMFVKGKATKEDIAKISEELANYKEIKPLRLFVDDITPEKLVSVLAENDGRMAILSSEAGLLDNFMGAYSKLPNFDVLLKAYSGDTIRVDRIGRDSESISDPSLTIFLMAQPNATSKFLSNEAFRGRGLTARFLYSVPKSYVGSREYRSTPVPQEVYNAYERKIFNILEDEYSPEPEVITLSPEADRLIEEFAQELEPKLVREYAEISDWCGKLVGNTLRIAGLLCRAGTFRSHDFLDEPEPLVVDEQTMKNAIRLGRYFLSHALAAYDILPESSMHKSAYLILKMIHNRNLTEFTRRDVMRNCPTLKRAEAVQPVLDFLEDYGYIKSLTPPPTYGRGRPPMAKYLVNPWADSYFCQLSQTSVNPKFDGN